VTFDLQAYRFHFRAREAIRFPPSGPANLLRGAFGSTLRKIACAPDCPSLAGLPARECPHRSACAYVRIFEPFSAAGPSGLADPPRPFVFRVSHLAARAIASGEEFCFDVNFFDARQPALDEFARAFTELARAEVVSTSSAPVSIGLDPHRTGTNRLRVEFLTPTELKSASTPHFAALFARARDRVSTLRALYGPGPLDIDFRAFGERARAIQMTRCEIRQVPRERRSSRTRQVHGIGGFVGVAEYEGDTGEFLPILEAARWTGVGRHCVWGNGEILPSLF
jgi:CRISPR-associated endoribonuclease Cas6